MRERVSQLAVLVIATAPVDPGSSTGTDPSPRAITSMASTG
jgi:hypothetical protein